jgi:hypothetical protein
MVHRLKNALPKRAEFKWIGAKGRGFLPSRSGRDRGGFLLLTAYSAVHCTGRMKAGRAAIASFIIPLAV